MQERRHFLPVNRVLTCQRKKLRPSPTLVFERGILTLSARRLGRHARSLATR